MPKMTVRSIFLYGSIFLLAHTCIGQTIPKLHTNLKDGIYETLEDGYIITVFNDANTSISIDTTAFILATQFKHIEFKYTHDTALPVLQIELSEQGQNILRQISSKNLGKRLAFIMQHRLLMAPYIYNKINSEIFHISSADEALLKKIALDFNAKKQ